MPYIKHIRIEDLRWNGMNKEQREKWLNNEMTFPPKIIDQGDGILTEHLRRIKKYTLMQQRTKTNDCGHDLWDSNV
jgi:hypothetical protein